MRQSDATFQPVVAGSYMLAWIVKRPWLSLPLLVVPAIWPYYREGAPRTIDGALHLLRISLLVSHLGNGMLYPRWVPEQQLGLGYPVFNFYAPAVYYATAILHVVGFRIFHALILVSYFSILLAGFGMYWLAWDTFAGTNGRSAAALLAATAYMYTPFLFNNIYVSGAFAAAMAQALLPWVFWSYRRLAWARQPDRYVLPAVLALGGVAVSHNLTLLFLIPIILIYTLAVWWRAGASYMRLGWLGLGFLLSAVCTAFFWLPALYEQRFIAETGYVISRTQWLPRSFWTWDNFLDRGLFYTYTFDRPVRLGVVQLGLAVLGWFVARRRDLEWTGLLLLALAMGLFMGRWALPIWMNAPLLVTAQFAWRLLSPLSLLLALFAGGLVCAVRPFPMRAVLLALALAAIIMVQRPRIAWMDLFDPETVDLSRPVVAQIELEKGIVAGGEGNSSIQEFRPRWADVTLTLEPASVSPGTPTALSLEQASAFEYVGSVTSTQDTVLRFTDYFFPGWSVFLDGQRVDPIPSTNLGLLTVKIPAGAHRLRVVWAGTPIQTIGAVLSLVAWAFLAFITWRAPIPRSLTALPLACFSFGVLASVLRPPLQPVQQSIQPLVLDGVQLVGYRANQAEDRRYLYLFPYWYVSETPDEGFRVRWLVADQNGHPLASITSYPYFNAYRASNWPALTLVDDAYRLPLPPGLPTGVYQLLAQVGADAPVLIAELSLEGTAAVATEISQPIRANFNGEISLLGYDLLADGKSSHQVSSELPIASPGQYLCYRLYWKGSDNVGENYHGFVHLVDVTGRPVAQEDHLPGPIFRPPLVWDALYPQPDTYLLRLPPNLAGGLYWPHVGLYRFESLDRLPVLLAESAESVGDHVTLSPVKIVDKRRPQPAQIVHASFGDWSELLGFDLLTPEKALRPGDSLALRLYYRSQSQGPGEFIRFTQLYSREQGIAAQYDSPPAHGGNPTWSWVDNEIIVDDVTLTISATAVPGTYTLYLGFYPRKDPTRRVVAYDKVGRAFPDGWVPLLTLSIQEGAPLP